MITLIRILYIGLLSYAKSDQGGPGGRGHKSNTHLKCPFGSLAQKVSGIMRPMRPRVPHLGKEGKLGKQNRDSGRKGLAIGAVYGTVQQTGTGERPHMGWRKGLGDKRCSNTIHATITRTTSP